MKTFQRLLTSLLFVSLAGQAIAQSDEEPFTIGQWQTVESKVLGESRRVLIGTPPEYERSEDRLPVLYLLDGDFHFPHTVGLLRFKAAMREAPPMIVVGIANTDRTRDLTPHAQQPSSRVTGGGGADSFLRFLREELIPFVDAEYRTSSYRILVGHSFGGLFAVHTLVHQPDAFNAYIAISPSLWWDEQRLVAQATEMFQQNQTLDRIFYMTLGNERGDMRGGVLKFHAALVEHAPKKLRWKSRIMDDETHGTVPYLSTLQGLEFIFEAWRFRDALAVYDAGGIEAIHQHFRQGGEPFGIQRTPPPVAFMSLAFTLVDRGRYAEAKAVLEHDPKNYPPSASIYAHLGDAQYDDGDHEAAIASYTSALTLDPSNTEVRATLAELGADPDSIAVLVELPVELLATYAGRYEPPGNEETMLIRLEDNDLIFEHAAYGHFVMSAKSETQFTAVQGLVTIEFHRDPKNVVTEMTVQSPEGVLKYRKAVDAVDD